VVKGDISGECGSERGTGEDAEANAYSKNLRYTVEDGPTSILGGKIGVGRVRGN